MKPVYVRVVRGPYALKRIWHGRTVYVPLNYEWAAWRHLGAERNIGPNWGGASTLAAPHLCERLGCEGSL